MYRINTISGDLHCPDGRVIPVPYDDPGYAAYADWVQAGGVPEEFDGGAPVPQSVTRFQALAALELSGLLDAVESFVNAPETPRMARLAWKNALVFERNSPTVAAIAAALGMSTSAVDDLFRLAASIQA